MLSEFRLGVAQLTNQSLLSVGFIAIVFAGTFMGAKKLAEDKSRFIIAIAHLVSLALLIHLTNDSGRMTILFTHPILVAIMGGITGAGYAMYRSLSER